MIYGMKAPLDELLGSHWGHFLNNFILIFYSVALWPLVIKLADRFLGSGRRA